MSVDACDSASAIWVNLLYDVNKTRLSMDHKPVILVFLGNYLPGFKSGGPLRTIVNLVDNLSDEFEFLIITSDRD